MIISLADSCVLNKKVNTNMNNEVKCFNHEEDDTSTIVKLPKLILKHILKKIQLSFKFQRRKKHTLISHKVGGTNVVFLVDKMLLVLNNFVSSVY